MSLRRGLTLVEVLVALGIVTLLTGVALPVIVKSKNGGKRVDNITALRQLGQAAALYHEAENAWPRFSRDLVRAGLVPPEICASKLDNTPKGIATQMLLNSGWSDAAAIKANPGYRDSYIGLGHFRFSEELSREWIYDTPGGGWLLDFTESERNVLNNPLTWEGRYRRLLFDTAVVVRSIYRFDCTLDGQPVPCAKPEMLFTDPSERLKEWVQSQK